LLQNRALFMNKEAFLITEKLTLAIHVAQKPALHHRR